MGRTGWAAVALVVCSLPCGSSFAPRVGYGHVWRAPQRSRPHVRRPTPPLLLADKTASSSSDDDDDTAGPVVRATLHPNGYLELCLNRARKLHSLDTEMLTLLRDALATHAPPLPSGAFSGEEEAAATRAPCRAIVIRSAPLGGRAFCAGGDVAHVAALGGARERVEFLHLE